MEFWHIEQRSDMIEVDLHRTRDGVVVVTHDAKLVGLGGTGEIADTDFESLRRLDAGGGEPIPTLDEMLDAFGARIAFNLELKRGTREDYPGLERVALDAVLSRGLLERTLFSSFYDPVLARLRAKDPLARIGLLLDRRFPHRALERAQAVGAEALHPEIALAEPGLVEAAHAAGLDVNVYTVNELDEMRRLVALGIDGLITNHPDRLRAFLESPRG